MSKTMLSKKVSRRDRILRAAAELLTEGGREAMTTRAVAAAAGVQAPTIYRQFGDMSGLLDEVASYGFSRYLRDKRSRERAEDPVEELRRGWDLHIEFGLANPAMYTLMYGNPRPGAEPTAALEAQEMLRGLVRRVAEAGRLRVGVESAVGLIHATGVGVVLTLIAIEDEKRDLALSDMAREAILAAVTTDETNEEETEHSDDRERLANRAVALGAVLPESGGELSSGERALLSEWLDRLTGPVR